MSQLSALSWTVAGYVLLAILLLSLNISSLWRWWIKAGAIVLTTVAFAITFLALNGLLGWPAVQGMPGRFSLVASRVIEPDKATGKPGQVFLWIEEVNTDNLPVAAPRAYEVAYSQELADSLEKAQERLEQGEQVLGEMLDPEKKKQREQQQQQAADKTAAGGAERGQGELGRSGKPNLRASGTALGASVFLPDISDSLLLSDMPPPELPDKP